MTTSPNRYPNSCYGKWRF